jgi:hypothetical protein
MNRRSLITVLAQSSALLGLGSNFFVSLRSGPFIVRDYYVSRRYPNKIFATTQEFWSIHYDLLGDKTNTSFLSSGRLLSKHSYLLDDQQTVVVEQVFRSKVDYTFREKVKKLLSKHAKMDDAICHVRQDASQLS